MPEYSVMFPISWMSSRTYLWKQAKVIVHYYHTIHTVKIDSNEMFSKKKRIIKAVKKAALKDRKQKVNQEMSLQLMF